MKQFVGLSKDQERKLILKIHEVCSLRLQYLKDQDEYTYYEMADLCGLHPIRISEIVNFRKFSIKWLTALIRGGLMSTAILLNNIQNLTTDEKEYINKFSIYEDSELLSLLERISNHKQKDKVLMKVKKLLMKEIEMEDDE